VWENDQIQIIVSER